MLAIMDGAALPRFGLVGPLGWSELLIILVIVLIFFGPRRLPEVAEAIGKSMRKFKKASRDVKDELTADHGEGEDDEEKRG